MIADLDLREQVDRGHDAVVDVRRTLHARPELGFDEHATTALLRERMLALGWTALPSPTPTGGVYELLGGRSGRSVLIRADIDALPVQEELDVPWRSAVDGVMHACGHDAHAAMLCGVAAALAARAEQLPGRYVAVFQPAEEALGGARAMLDAGLLEICRADVACGVHVAAPLPTGLVATRPGIFYSAFQGFVVDLRGAGGHGATMGTQGNVLLAAAELASRLGEVAAGLEHEDVGCVCSAGALHAGSTGNVVPRSAAITGSIRTFTPDQAVTAVERLRELAAGVAAAHGVAATVRLTFSTPALHNDPTSTARAIAAVQGVLGEDRAFEMPPITPSDDMAEILARVPGVYLAVGARPGASEPPQHHAADFTIDEEALRVGTLALTATALALALAATTV